MSESDKATGTHRDGNDAPAAEDAAEAEERQQPSVSEPGGFKNDPDDSTNPNEVIERHRRTVRA